jgi:hypothetical protein
MEENETIIITRGKFQKKGINSKRVTITIPQYLLYLVDQEAKEKDKSRSNVISYLILSGLKAHTGEFFNPAKNTIRDNWIKRGKRW